MLLLWGAGALDHHLDPAGERGRLYNVLLGLLPLAASLVIAAVLWRSAAGDIGRGRALAFWCNPAMLLAAILGYQDPVFGAAALGCVLALVRRRYILATALVVVAGLLKPQGSLLLPTLLALLLTETRPRTWLQAAAAGAATAVAILTPWWASGYLLSALVGSTIPLTESTASAQGASLWWLVGYVAQWIHGHAWPLALILTFDEFQRLAGFDPRLPARLLLLASTLANMALLLRRPAEDRSKVPLSVMLQVHLYALLGTSVHENHAFLAVVIAPLLLGAWEHGRATLAFTSALLFANLFLLEGLGRGLIGDRALWRIRLAAGLDLTALVALAHLAFVALLFAWSARVSSSRGERDAQVQASVS